MSLTKTWNNDIAYKTTNDPRLDLFYSGFVRFSNEEKLNNMLQLSWQTYPEDTIKLIFHSRDCRNGKGERKVSYRGMLWLRKNKPLTYILNLNTFLELGYFKDLLVLAGFVIDENQEYLGTDNQILELELFAEFLKKDIERFEKYGSKAQISLASKWAPSEGKHFDVKYGFVDELVGILFPECILNHGKKKYRIMLSTLRSHLNIVEQLIAKNMWDNIDYSKVPSKAHKILRNAFLKHAPKEYETYLNNLKLGKIKINITGTAPHELIKTYLEKNINTDNTIECMWNTLVNDVKTKGTLNNTIAISDVSGSMFCNNNIPISVSIAMGILISQCTNPPFNNKVITFSEHPEIHHIDEDSLLSSVNNIKNMSWGMNTNIDSVFNLLLNSAILNNIHPDNMIKNIIIISDMQFDCAILKSNKSAFQRAKFLFESKGYTLPNIVFWNVNGLTGSVPVQTHDSGSILISGFSASLLKDLIEHGFNVSPIDFLLHVIGKYDVFIDENEK